MFKKLFMGLGLVALGSYLWMGTSVGSYARTGYHQAKRCFKGQVPIEFEIQRAKQLLAELAPNIHQTLRTIAEEEVKIARLHSEVALTEQNLDRERVAIQALKDQVAKGLASYNLGRRNYTADELRRELNRRFTSFQRAESSLTARKEVLKAREDSLRAARSQYDELLDGKQRLEADIAALEARYRTIEAQKSANQIYIDDSKFAKVQSLIQEIEDRLNVNQIVAEKEGNLLKRVPVEDLPPADLVEQVDEYFGSKPTANAAL